MKSREGVSKARRNAKSRRFYVRAKGLLAGSDPHGFTLRNDARNARTMSAAWLHERGWHYVMDLMDDTPEGDVAVGMCCSSCDWQRTFEYLGRRAGRALVEGSRGAK